MFFGVILNKISNNPTIKGALYIGFKLEKKERDSKNETLKCIWYIKIEVKYRMLNIQVDERAIRRLYLEKLEEKLKEVDAEFVFWDTSELKK